MNLVSNSSSYYEQFCTGCILLQPVMTIRSSQTQGVLEFSYYGSLFAYSCHSAIRERALRTIFLFKPIQFRLSHFLQTYRNPSNYLQCCTRLHQREMREHHLSSYFTYFFAVCILFKDVMYIWSSWVFTYFPAPFFAYSCECAMPKGLKDRSLRFKPPALHDTSARKLHTHLYSLQRKNAAGYLSSHGVQLLGHWFVMFSVALVRRNFCEVLFIAVFSKYIWDRCRTRLTLALSTQQCSGPRALYVHLHSIWYKSHSFPFSPPASSTAMDLFQAFNITHPSIRAPQKYCLYHSRNFRHTLTNNEFLDNILIAVSLFLFVILLKDIITRIVYMRPAVFCV